MTNAAISIEQSTLLTRAVSDLLVQAEAESVFLTDCSGYIVASASTSGDADVQTIAALSAGSFSATRHLAQIIGEPTFRSVYHQGNRSSIFMQSITSNFLLLVIFGRNTTVGLVKLYVEKASRELDPILSEVPGQTSASVGGSGHKFSMAPGETPFRQGI